MELTSVNGGIPGIDPPNFASTPDIINALQSFAIWFTYQSPGSACTFAPGGGSYAYVNPIATAQFCDPMSAPQAFPPGDSLLTVQLTDAGGNVGPTAQIIVRVSTRTPTPTMDADAAGDSAEPNGLADLHGDREPDADLIPYPRVRSTLRWL